MARKPIKKILRGLILAISLFLPLNVFATTLNQFSSSGDGYCGNGTDGTIWADELSSANCANNIDISNESSLAASYNTASDVINRGFLPFDTSTITDGATINSGTISVYVPSGWKFDDSNEAGGYIVAVSSTRPDPADIAASDFSKCGTTPLTEELDITSVTVDQYNEFTLNAAGLAYINDTGITDFCFRTGYDLTGTQNTSSFDEIGIRYSEYTGTANDPFITIIYGQASATTTSDEEQDFVEILTYILSTYIFIFSFRYFYFLFV